MTNILDQIGVSNLTLRGGSTAFNRLDRFFSTLAEAESAVANNDYTPDPTATNGVLIGEAGYGFCIWDFDNSTFVPVNFSELTAEALITQKINDLSTSLVNITSQTADGLIAEKGLRISGDSALSTRITALEADPTTQTLLDAEATARAAADGTIQTDLDAAEADIVTNAGAISAETTARIAADTALSTRVTTIENDNASATLLTAETNARTAADTALSGRLDSLEADPTTASAVTAAIAAEATARGTAISTAIDNLVDAAPGALDTLNELAAALGDDSDFASTITTSVGAEATTRAAADTALSGRLDTIEATASITDPTTATALTAEGVTRAAADSALDARLLSLEGNTAVTDPCTGTQLTSLETDLEAQVNSVQSALGGHISASGSARGLLSSRITTVEGTLGSVTSAELNYLDATSSIQTQLDEKINEDAVALMISATSDYLQAQITLIQGRLNAAGMALVNPG
nr:Phage-related protein [uncultured Mediterranean phage uvMED]